MEHQILHADTRTSSARQIPLHHPLFSWPTVARIPPSYSGDSCQKLIMRQFRDETKPSKHCFGRSEQIRRTSLQETRVKLKSLSTCLELNDFVSKSHAVHRTTRLCLQRVTRKDLQLRLVSLAKSTSYLSRGPKTVFRGLVSSRNCL